MTLDGGFYIFGEVRIDDGRGVGGKHGNTLGDAAAHRLSGMKKRNWTAPIPNNNFRARPHVRQKRRYAGSGGLFL
jgi:hypothetical protein